MTIQQLRVFLQKYFCGCGRPEDAVERLRDLLALHPLYNNREKFEALVPDTGIEYLLLYMLDHMGLTSHGGTVGGGWLTDLGTQVLAALTVPGAFAASTVSCCIHGYSIDFENPEECLECRQYNRRNPT